MKTILTLTLLLLASPLAARASDLSRDLQVPFAPLTNPFSGVEAKPLENPEALKALLERCTFIPGKFSGAGVLSAELETEILPACASELSLSAEKNVLLARGLGLEVVSWDGSQSDGGDEQAIGVYDTRGRRLAVYPALFVDGNAINGIAHAIGAALPVVRR